MQDSTWSHTIDSHTRKHQNETESKTHQTSEWTDKRTNARMKGERKNRKRNNWWYQNYLIEHFSNENTNVKTCVDERVRARLDLCAITAPPIHSMLSMSSNDAWCCWFFFIDRTRAQWERITINSLLLSFVVRMRARSRVCSLLSYVCSFVFFLAVVSLC